MRKIITIGIIAFAIFGFGGWLWFTMSLQPVSEQGLVIPLTIASGDSLNKVASNLSEAKLIRSERAFIWYAKNKGVSAKIQVGSYDLNQNMSVADIISAITNGDHLSREQQLTIIEGWTSDQIGAHVRDRLKLSEDEWQKAIALSQWQDSYAYLSGIPAKTVEGFLFPDTYRVFSDATAIDVVKKTLDNFDRQLTEQMRQDIKRADKTIFEVITLASIVERESKIADMPMIADIFWKRLEIGMPLQSDATVNYVTGQSKLRPTFNDLAFNSPYNTYKYPGLPPGPISNPSLAAIKATIYPTPNEFYYFLTDSSGKAYYGRTYQEHQANIAAYLD
jgi:UPF0755 protein